MFKKSQINYILIIYILVFVVAGLTLYLSITGFQTFKKGGKEIEITSFVVTLENSLKSQQQKGFGSKDPITFSLPSEIERVCFVDDEERFSPHSSLELTREKEFYQDRNVFFFPSERYTPAKIGYVKLEDDTNPLCVDLVDGKLNLQLTTLANDTLVQAINDDEVRQDCIIVPGSEVGNPDEKIDLVFASYGYEDKNLFAQDVLDYTNNYLFQIEPFRGEKQKFNIWMIDDMEPECSVTHYVFCDSFSVNKLVSNCPNDYVFILVDRSAAGYSVRSSAVSNMVKINTRDNRLVALHEFAHIFANLADEYTDSYYESWFEAEDYPNCDTLDCPSWGNVEGMECVKGCSTNRFYRSSDDSIMRNYDKVDYFGILNEGLIIENLEAYD